MTTGPSREEEVVGGEANIISISIIIIGEVDIIIIIMDIEAEVGGEVGAYLTAQHDREMYDRLGYIHTYIHTYRQTDRQTTRHTDRNKERLCT